jgi:tRNA threonylcarbamoyladenosine biosynthesis protein TsaB
VGVEADIEGIIIQSMLVLALDTTTASGSCALARDGAVVLEHAADAPHEHAERLPGDLISLLDRAGIGLSRIDVFAVATGPGSFTGLRIGIATMQGLAFAEGKPLIGVSAFDALARRAGPEGRVATWVDAWRGEVFAALYDGGREVEAPVVSRPQALLDRLRGGPVRLLGDGVSLHRQAIHEALGANGLVIEPPAPPLAGTIAMLAHEAAAAGDQPPPHAIRPLYVRRTDAELARDARSTG